MGEKTFLLSVSKVMKRKADNFRREYTSGNWVWRMIRLKLSMTLYLLETHVCSGVCVAQPEGHCFSLPHLFIGMELQFSAVAKSRLEPRSSVECWLKGFGLYDTAFIVTLDKSFPSLRLIFLISKNERDRLADFEFTSFFLLFPPILQTSTLVLVPEVICPNLITSSSFWVECSQWEALAWSWKAERSKSDHLFTWISCLVTMGCSYPAPEGHNLIRSSFKLFLVSYLHTS